MITQDRHALKLAICLAALAGFTDALGFMELGGFFVSFMSGNSTRFAVGLMEHNMAAHSLIVLTLLPLGLITLFVAGVMTGVFLQHRAGKYQMSAVLGFVVLCLLLAALLHAAGFTRVSIALMVLAMGAENNVFVKDGQVNTGVTYMTGTLVKFAQKFANGFLGGSRKDALPFLFLWLGLVTGAVIGAACYAALGLHSLWFAAVFAGLLLFAVNNLEKSR